MTERQNAQLVTCGIFYCRVSANLKGCGSLQTSSWLDSDVLRNRQQKHTAKPLGPIAAHVIENVAMCVYHIYMGAS